MNELFTTPETIVAYAQVAPEQGVDVTASGLTYGIPEALKDITVGDRVLVPLGRGNKQVPGFVVQIDDSTTLPANKLKAITEKDPAGIHLPADLIDLARWLSGYYCCPIGMVFGTMLPAAVKHGIGASVQTLVYRNPDKDIKTVKLSKLQKAAVAELEKCEADGRPQIEMRELAELAGAKSISPVKQLITKGVLKSNTQSIIKAPKNAGDQPQAQKSAKLLLNDTQQKAVEKLASKVDDGGFGVHLLHGVTGSGKTEVYLQMIEHVFAKRPESCAIVLVPEIALTPQTVSRFTARFDAVAVMHSALTSAQRHEQWRRIAAGEAKIVIGARSAIFAPLPEVGIIIVDEEHDSSYKQDQLPRYHARDVAVKRGQQLGSQVILGSATPSLESYYNATVRGTYDLLHLPDRVSGFKLPHVQLVDLIEERKHRRGVHLLSRKLEELIGYVKKQGGQTMLLLNRRGYANYVACPDHTCGWMQACEHCDATMVYHKHQLPMGSTSGAGGFIRCHHCENEQLLKPLCPQCGKKITLFGLGTQRVEEEIERKFPELKFARMDSDTMRQREDYQRILGQFQKGELDLLIGTQMIAKGLDFPNVRLVGVISGDTSLHMPDFRAAERTFQLIAQVAGRAGRSSTPGLVVVQTFSINDPTIKLASQHDFITFAQRELEMRDQMGLPPHTRMARVVVRDVDHEKSYLMCKKLSQELARCNQQLNNVVRLRGPMPCPIARIADFHRHQIEMVAPDAGTLQKLMTMLRNERLLISDNRMAVDVDPTVLL